MSRLASTSMPSRRTRQNRSTTSTLRQEPRRYAAVASRLSSTSDMTSFHKTGCGSAKHSSKLDALLSPCTIFDKEKMKGDFLAYFKKLADKKNSKCVIFFFIDFFIPPAVPRPPLLSLRSADRTPWSLSPSAPRFGRLCRLYFCLRPNQKVFLNPFR